MPTVGPSCYELHAYSKRMITMTSARGSLTLLRALLVLAICCDVQSDLIVKPKDSEAVVGGKIVFNCSTTLASTEIHWFHYAVGDSKDRSFVYGYDQFYSPYLGRFQMEKNSATGAYNLIIPSVTIDDAGRFECQDDTGRGDKDSAQLTVLDENPVCQSNMKPAGFIGPNICGFEPEELHLTCAVQYRGNQPPIMQWKEVKSGNPIGEGVTHNISSNRAIYYLKMVVNSRMDGSSYQCMTTRSTVSQYGCAAVAVIVKNSNRASVIIIISCVVVCFVSILIALLVGFILGKILRCRGLKQTKSRDNAQHRSTSNDPEQIALSEKRAVDMEQLRMDNEELQMNTEQLRMDNEQLRMNNEQMRTDTERLAAKINELEQHRYNTDNTRYRTASSLAHTITTQASEKKSPVTGIAILENSLFVVYKNCQDIEVYDSKTFVFERLIQSQPITNPLDIAASKEDKRLYVFNRTGVASSEIIKVYIAGEGGKVWVTENDDGRLSTFESSLIVCFCTKRIIIEYSPEGIIINTVRLSPGNRFNNIWHAVKLTGTHFAVSHSKVEDGQRVCVVDINGNVLTAFEELPTLSATLIKTHLPVCLVEDGEESVLVADAKERRVLLLSSKLKYEGVLIETGRNQIPVRLCLSETRDRVFVGVNSGNPKPESWKEGRVLIYNIRK